MSACDIPELIHFDAEILMLLKYVTFENHLCFGFHSYFMHCQTFRGFENFSKGIIQHVRILVSILGYGFYQLC
jgi:hypothetical protein